LKNDALPSFQCKFKKHTGNVTVTISIEIIAVTILSEYYFKKFSW